MTPELQKEKLAQFTEFFTIDYDFSVNLEKLTSNAPTSQSAFEKLIPLPFKLASDNAVIDQKSLRPIQNLSNHASQLVEYLQQQANKIDLLVNYILSEHDDENKRYQGTSFGGGGFSFLADDSFSLGEKISTKIFMLDQNCAIYSHAEVIEKLADKDVDEQYHYKVIFSHIREDDREVMVRTSLHVQSQQLQALAQARNQAAK